MRRPSTRVLAGAVLLVALVLAGFVSRFASSEPDGLTKVSQDQGFAGTETAHAADDAPFAGYAGGGAAGVVGVLVVLALGTGLTLAVRRRSPEPSAPTAPTTSAT